MILPLTLRNHPPNLRGSGAAGVKVKVKQSNRPLAKSVESYLIGRSGSEKLHKFKGEWSPKIAKDLYCLLSKKRIK